MATLPRVRDRQDVAYQPAPHRVGPKAEGNGLSLALIWMILCLLVGGGCLLPSFFSNGNEKLFQEEEVPRFITKNIEDVEEGDYVLARDEFGNDIGLRRVVEVYRRTSDHLRILTFQADDGTQQTLETTNEHPFWVVGDKTFTDAKDLKVGDQVTSPHGELQTLLATKCEPHAEGVAVFNFQVEGYHTYYVREHGTRGPPLLVHNSGCDQPSSRRAAFRRAKRDAGIPQGEQPSRVNSVPMTDRNGKVILDENHKPIMTREYEFKDRGVVIQDHSAGHTFGDPNGIGDQGPHFNVRPIGDTRTGHIPGTDEHYFFD